MSKLPPDRRDDLLHDLYSDEAASALASRMATRIRRKRRIRHAGTACVVIAILGATVFQITSQRSQSAPATAVTEIHAPSASAVEPSPGYTAASDAELLAALKDERVMIFTLADGQRQVVWLSGTPRI